MPLRVLIVDDDEKERIVLRYILEQIKDVEIVGEAVKGLEALLLFQEKKVDLAFFGMPSSEMTVLQAGEKVNKLKDPPLFAIISSRKELAVDAYEVGAIDFICRPFEQKRIVRTLHRAKMQKMHRDEIDLLVQEKIKQRIEHILENFDGMEGMPRKLLIREKGKIIILDQSDIVYCESQGKKVYVSVGKDEGYLSNYTLNELEERLDSNFFRAHQAFIVNLNYVREIVSFGDGSYQLHLNRSGKNVILSRSRAKTLRKKLGI